MEIRRYDEKIAVVTGAANGIGLSMVKRLVEEGAKVAALDIDTETMEKEYAGQEEDIYQVYCDVAEKESVDQAIAKVLEHFGRIDVLFSNAGIIGRQSLLDTTEETWRRVIDINLNGMFFVNQAVLRSMVERGIKGCGGQYQLHCLRHSVKQHGRLQRQQGRGYPVYQMGCP